MQRSNYLELWRANRVDALHEPSRTPRIATNDQLFDRVGKSKKYKSLEPHRLELLG
jgi:hypothetical protein